MDVVRQHYIVDLSSNNNFIQMSAMQGDGYGVRYAEIELFQNGQKYIIDADEVTVDIMGTKPDTKEIWNPCEVTEDGNIVVEITQQMVAKEGRGDYVIVILNKEHNQQLKSFPFIIITTKAPYDATYLESTDEFQRLAAAIIDGSRYARAAEKSAEEALQSELSAKSSELASAENRDASETYKDLSKSYAVGTDGEVREGDATDNAKYYSEQAQASKEQAEDYKDSAEDFAKKSESYAVGTDGEYRVGDETDNSKYYSEQSRIYKEGAMQTYNNVVQAGIDAVDAINNALDISRPNFVMDLTTGHLKYEGGRFDFRVQESTGHLLWEMTV